MNTVAGDDVVPSNHSIFNNKIFTTGFEIWMIGIVIVIGGDYFCWNSGFEAGFGSFCISTILSGTAYIALICCTSETLSSLPFVGGAYGIVRCTIGFYPGFLIGCSETLEYIIYTALAACTFGSMICDVLAISRQYQPIIWFMFYAVACLINIKGGLTFWRFNNTIGIVSLSVIIFYCFGCLKWTDFSTNATNNEPFFNVDVYKFLNVFPLSSWFYVGVESIGFTCNMVENARNVVPKATVACILCLFVTSLFVMFVCGSLPPGTRQVSFSSLPLNFGFSLIFGVGQQEVRQVQRFISLLSIPATFATGYGFVFAYGKLLNALAGSGLMPAIFEKRTHLMGTPYVATRWIWD